MESHLRIKRIIRRIIRLVFWLAIELVILVVLKRLLDGEFWKILASASVVTLPRLEVTTSHGKIMVTIKGPISFELSETDKDLRKVLTIALALFTVPVVAGKGHHLSQKEIAAAIGVSLPTVSQWLQRFREEGLSGLLRRIRRPVSWPKEIIDQLIIWQAEDPCATPETLAKKLNEAGLLSEVVEPEDIAAVFSRVDFNRMRPILADAFTRRAHSGKQELSEKNNYIIQRLFELNERLIASVGLMQNSIRVDLQELKQKYHQSVENAQKRAYNWDRDISRPIAAMRRALKLQSLKALLQSKQSPEIRCPHCGSARVRIKETRKCHLRDIDGQVKESFSKRFYCNNPNCSHKTFTIPADEREVGARVTKSFKAQALNQLFHLRASLRHCADALSSTCVHHTTILRWVQELAAELPSWYELFPVRSSGRIVVDEKWVKLHRKWYYVFFAVDDVSLDLLHIDVFPSTDAQCCETFLRQLKSMGFNPDVIVTDLMCSYAPAVRQVFPTARHRECLLHAERNARRAILRAVGKRDDPRYEHLVEPLRRVFVSKTLSELDKAWQDFHTAAQGNPKIEQLAKRIEENCRSIVEYGLRNPADPSTTNAVERVIEEFDRKYKQMQAFCSFPSLRAWCMLHQVYFRLRPFKRGRFAGLSPAQVLGYPVENLDWVDYVLGVLPRKEKASAAA